MNHGFCLWNRILFSNRQWKYVNLWRILIFLNDWIKHGPQRVVSEPNGVSTWANVRLSITHFLTSMWHSGALMGTFQKEAFFVSCDCTTMNQDDIDQGRLICHIGLALVKPAEFLILRICHQTAENTAQKARC